MIRFHNVHARMLANVFTPNRPNFTSRTYVSLSTVNHRHDGLVRPGQSQRGTWLDDSGMPQDSTLRLANSSKEDYEEHETGIEL